MTADEASSTNRDKPGVKLRIRTMTIRRTIISTILFLGLSACMTGSIPISPAASAQLAGLFDGTWNVIFSCPTALAGTAGHTRRFIASVLHGQVGVVNQAGYLALDGTIQADGGALLTGHGLPEIQSRSSAA